MLPVVFIAFGVLLVGVLVWRMVSGGSSESIEERLNELAALGQTMTLDEIELSQPFAQRVIVPIWENVVNFAQRMTPENSRERIQLQIDRAGLSYKLTPGKLMAQRFAWGAGLAGLTLFISLISGLDLLKLLLMVSVAGAVGFLIPGLMLGQKKSRRQKEVLKSMPDALDLLTICVEAGLGFDAGMAKIAEKWENEISLSFSKAVQEMQLGKLRREALRNMSDSLDIPDMTSFVAAIIQADQLGVSMAKVMKIQSEMMRMKRRQRAEEKARQAPVKMMFPLVFFIFPTILIVLLGPAVIQIKESGALDSL